MEVRHDCTDPRTNQAGRDRHRYDREVCHRTVAILRPDVVYGDGLEARRTHLGAVRLAVRYDPRSCSGCCLEHPGRATRSPIALLLS
ncbi:hypothetical protein NSPZN2_100453 [Nitrospira defluvii]|uniref:Transposase n=1 Tax=Nitrospira defluvii TaxID=330214 RepID=A0ABM8R4U9_9BACT|nr:hypothetical protein NSPZN2_100453 [Nitrospira defluvii]